MLLSDISVQGVAGTLLATDEMLETIAVLKTELQQRVRQELDDLDMRRNALLEALGENPAKEKPAEEKPPQPRGPVNPPKYRNPDNPNITWSGRGKRPAWVVDYLATNLDGTLADLLIQPQPQHMLDDLMNPTL